MNSIREALTKMFEILFILIIVLGMLVLAGWLIKTIWLGVLAGLTFIETVKNFK